MITKDSGGFSYSRPTGLEYKFLNGYPDNLEKRMSELSKDGWHVNHIDLTQTIIRVLMVRFLREANPSDHPSVSSLG